MRYTMKLDEVPFEQIANGTKTIEMRLNDEKRRKIVIGDEIEFTSLLSAKTLLAKVINKYVFSSFEELYVKLPLEKCGYTNENIDFASPHDMFKYYSLDQQFEDGVVGIELSLIK